MNTNKNRWHFEDEYCSFTTIYSRFTVHNQQFLFSREHKADDKKKRIRKKIVRKKLEKQLDGKKDWNSDPNNVRQFPCET